MWVLVRIAGIIVGIATLLRLATTQGLVTYDPLFQEWMDRLQDLVELGFLTDLIEPLLHRFIDWVRSFGWQLPDLQPVWRPIFVLGSLYFGAFARNDESLSAVLIPVGIAFALGASLIAGLNPVPGAVLGFLLFISLLWTLLDALSGDLHSAVVGMVLTVGYSISLHPDLSWVSALTLFAVALYVGNNISWNHAGGFIGPLFLCLVALYLPGVTPGMLIVAVCVFVLFQGLRIFLGSIQGYGRWYVDWSPGSAKIGLDILGVMLGSLAIASIFASPPIW